MILCIDCGLTNGKVLLFSTAGDCCGENSFPTPLDYSLIHTHTLRESLYSCIWDLLRNTATDPKEISCITVSGHGNGLYAIGQTDVLPVGYSSMVTESAEFLPENGKTFPIILQSDWAGQPLPILAWLKKTKSSEYRQAKKVLFCKDLLRWFLTGVAVTEETDASAAGLLNAHTGEYDRKLLQIYDVEDAYDKLPSIVKSDACAGYVTAEASKRTGLCEKTPVLAGLFDVNSCMLGTGVIDDDAYAIIAGTWGINALASKTLVESASITQCCRFYGVAPYVCIDSAPTSCSNLEWFVNNVMDHMPYEQVNQIVAQQRADENLIYLPYLYAPMDSPDAQGGFLGLRPQHTKADMLRAVFEGIVFEHRYRLEKLQAIGVQAEKAILSGGAASSDIFAQMFADICGVTIRRSEQKQAGAFGGAILGLVSMGVYPDIRTAVDSLVRYSADFAPTRNQADYYQRKYCRIKQFKKMWG